MQKILKQKEKQDRIKTQSSTGPSSTRKLVLALSGIVMSILLTSLDGTIVGTAMPRIIAELQGFSLYTWVTTIYLLSSTAVISVAGKLGDLFGRKGVVLAAVVIFLLGSVLSGAAPTMTWLVVFRGIQGIGAGCLQANAFATISDLFKDSAQRARWQGYIAAFFGLTSILGPVVGGFITDNFNWRWVFYINLPLGLIAIMLLIFTLPNLRGIGSGSIDWWGAATITSAIISLLLALSWGGQPAPTGYPWISPQIIGLFTIATMLIGLFIVIELRTPEPILPLRLFSLPMVRSVSVISFGQNLIMLGTLLFIGLYMQVVINQSAFSSGVIITPLILAMITANILSGQFMGRIGLVKVPMLAGIAILGVGVALLLNLNGASSVWQVGIYIVVIGFALGMIGPSLTIGVQELVERRDLGVATSTVQFFGSIGSTVGTGLIGSIVTAAYVSNITQAGRLTNLPPATLEIIQGPQNLLNPQIANALSAPVIELARQALVDATHSGFVICLGVALLAFLIALTVPNIRIKSASRQLQTEGVGLFQTTGEVSSPALVRDQPIVPTGSAGNLTGSGNKARNKVLITITYQAGSRGVEIGQTVARRLQLEYVDRQIVQEAAQRIGRTLAEQQPVDETSLGITPGFISTLIQANPTAIFVLAGDGFRPLEELEYHEAIQMVIEETARRERVLIAGYRANFALALAGYQNILNVYVYAPLEERIRKVMADENKDFTGAVRFIEKQDTEQANYIKRVYRKKIDDPSNYHLMINTVKLNEEAAAGLISNAFVESRV